MIHFDQMMLMEEAVRGGFYRSNMQDGAWGGQSPPIPIPDISKVVGPKVRVDPEKEFTSKLSAQMDALAAGDTARYPELNIRPEEILPRNPSPTFPRQTYPTVCTYGRKTVIADIYLPPVGRSSQPQSVPKRSEGSSRVSSVAVGGPTTSAAVIGVQNVDAIDTVVADTSVRSVAPAPNDMASLNREIADLRRQVVRLEIGDAVHFASNVGFSANSTAVFETPDEANVRLVRTKLIISEVSFDKKQKKRLELAEIDEIQQKVEGKIHSDRNSTDNEIYQRNHALLHHLLRRQKYSKRAYEILKQFWLLLGVSGDLVSFTGQLFDRDYLDPKSDKYFKYVSILTFMLKYQRLSKVHAKAWFKAAKDHDQDDYFFGNWQLAQTETDV